MKTTLRNCQFAFRCTKTWDILVSTNNETIRYCDDCKENVYLCKTDSDILAAIRQNSCVAILPDMAEGTESIESSEESNSTEQEEFFGVGSLEVTPYKVTQK